jgi:uncharacterized membrane protein
MIGRGDTMGHQVFDLTTNRSEKSALDTEKFREHLALANKHVAQGRQRVERQAALFAKLESGGHDITQAKALLEQLRHTLALQIETRDRILRELGETK